VLEQGGEDRAGVQARHEGHQVLGVNLQVLVKLGPVFGLGRVGRPARGIGPEAEDLVEGWQEVGQAKPDDGVKGRAAFDQVLACGDLRLDFALLSLGCRRLLGGFSRADGQHGRTEALDDLGDDGDARLRREVLGPLGK